MTALKLSYIPIYDSMHVYLNGLEMRENIDWVWDEGSLITFQTPMDVRSGDRVECLYAHYGDEVPVVTGDFLATDASGSFSDTNCWVDSPPHSAGDFLLVFVETNGPMATPPAGWSYYDTYVESGGYARLIIWYRIGAGSTSIVSEPGALASLTWYTTATIAYTGGLTSIAEVVWATRAAGSGFPRITPVVGGEGRIVSFYCNHQTDGAMYANGATSGTMRFNNLNVGNGPYLSVTDEVMASAAPVTWNMVGSDTHPSIVGQVRLA